MATRENNTMAEGCDKLLKQIASMEQEPDADMEFLGALRGDILTYLKPPTPQPASAAPGGASSALASPLGGAMGAVMGQSAQAPNPDEMRRMLSPS